MNGTNRLIESQRVTALKKGDALAFDELFGVYGKRLYHFSLGYLKSRQEAEEVVQDVFMRIWHNRSTLDPALSFNAYLFKIAYRQIIEKFRKISQAQKYLHDIAEETLNFTNETDERTNYQSLLELVERLIGKLPDRQREVLVLRRIEGMPVAGIAEKLGIAPKTVEHHITEALKNIKSGLEQENISGLLFFALFVRA